MSDAADCEQPSDSVLEETADKTETIPIVELESPSDPLPPPPDEEWVPVPENVNGKSSPLTYCLLAVAPVVLGILSLLLLVLCGFFGYHYFQSVPVSESTMKTFAQWIQALQDEARKVLQIQDTVDQTRDILKELQNQDRCLIKPQQEIKGDRCESPLNHWVKYGNYCYHQTTDNVSWSECDEQCSLQNATFLNTERICLLDMMKHFSASRAWLDIFYSSETNEWKSKEGPIPSPGLFHGFLPRPGVEQKDKCVYLDTHTLGTDNCTKLYACICEKAVAEDH